MAYEGTAVPVERSKEAIRKILIAAGARGVQFAEDFEEHRVNVRFAKEVGKAMRTVSVTLLIQEPPKKRNTGGWRHGRYRPPKSQAELWEQSARSTYRALHYWLKSQFEAVDFGLLSFEDVFLSHFEWLIKGKPPTTVGALVKAHLPDGSSFLPAPSRHATDILEGEVVRDPSGRG
jgi:hypothetical protein